ncbi:MAG TPA: DoxX family protein [Chitinophagales bacterium]|nr:DoxX family protein [Chitinophagales bacterium]
MFKQILATKVTALQANLSLLLLRVTLGVLMIPHGYMKLTKFSELQEKFMDFMGLGKSVALSLTIGAEFFCSILLVAGLLTRFSVVPLIIAMIVAVFTAHNGEIFGDGEHAFLYLIGYVVILIAGGGKYSADGLLLKK